MPNSHLHQEFVELESVVIRFAGDSGDGMQLTGTQFTNTAAVLGNDISTFPDFPAEIRAPAGTLAGVSGFQVHLSREDIYTPGDEPDVLVAMNPAALKVNLADVKKGGTIIINSDEFSDANLKKAGYESNPLEDGSLRGFEVNTVRLTHVNRESLNEFPGLSNKERDRCKNFFALGLTFWIYDRPLDSTLEWIEAKFAKKTPEIAAANRKALEAGYHYGETAEAFQRRYHISRAHLPPGVYRKITGNEAVAMGMVTAATLAGKPLFYATYPITPASDILHSLAPMKHYDVRTFQAEDEIAAMTAIIGASFGGALAATASSGPGICLKAEAMGLANVLELPMVIVDVQRGGPSTGLPTKTEQADLLQVLFCRNGESPLPVVAPATPAECFDLTVQAFRFAVRVMGPVIVLTDGFLANSSEPWLIPDPDTMEPIRISHEPHSEPFLPYQRDPQSLGRAWVVPGTPGHEHRIGGLAKAPGTGNVSYDPDHHQKMVDDYYAKVERLQEVIPPQEVFGPEQGDLLVLGWGSTYGAIRQAVINAQRHGQSVAHAHLRYLSPFPKNLGAVLGNYRHILLPEMNMGQLALLLRGKFLKDVRSLTKVKGRPFMVSEIASAISEILDTTGAPRA